MAEVIGRVTLSDPSEPEGIAVPDRTADAAGGVVEGSPRPEKIIASTSSGAGPGGLVGAGESREAADPFGKVKTPVDAYCACILDHLSL